MSKKAIRTFEPMNAVKGIPHPPELTGGSVPSGNANYKGDVTAKSNKNDGVADKDNCRVYINRLPRAVTPKQVLEAIRNCGKVKSCRVNNASDKDPLTADAHVTFFDRASAEALIKQDGRFQVSSGLATLPQLRWNRNPMGPEDDAGKSRVLRITGSAKVVNFESLSIYFQKKVEYQLEKVVTVWSGPGMAQMDWYFSGWSPQAKAVKMSLEFEYPDVTGNLLGVRVEVRDDPCAFPEADVSAKDDA